MELMFEMISRQKFLPDIRPTCVFSEVGGYIGRAAESDWVLPDRAKRVSRKHVLISCDGRDFYLEDLSSNGVLLVLTKELVGKNGRYKICHSDSFQISDYVIQARILMDPEVYTPRELDASSSDIIPDEAFLDLDPLKALDQEDETRAKRRLGFYDSLLGAEKPPARPMSDHNEARRDAIGPIKAKPDELLPPRKSTAPKTAEPSGDPLAAIENSIKFLRETMARMGETLKSLEAARDFLRGERPGRPADDQTASASVIPDDFKATPAPIIPEDFNPNDLF